MEPLPTSAVLLAESSNAWGFGLSSRGPDHVNRDETRQDAFRLHIDENSLWFITCDGLGSQKFSHFGAEQACEEFSRIASEILTQGRLGLDPTDQAREIVRRIQEGVSRSRRATIPTSTGDDDCACTIQAFVTDYRSFLSFNIGDGGSVLFGGREPNVRLLNAGRRLTGVGVTHIFSKNALDSVFYEGGPLPDRGQILAWSDGMDEFFIGSDNQISQDNLLKISSVLEGFGPDPLSKIAYLKTLISNGEKGGEMGDDKTFVFVSWESKKTPRAEVPLAAPKKLHSRNGKSGGAEESGEADASAGTLSQTSQGDSHSKKRRLWSSRLWLLGLVGLSLATLISTILLHYRLPTVSSVMPANAEEFSQAEPTTYGERVSEGDPDRRNSPTWAVQNFLVAKACLEEADGFWGGQSDAALQRFLARNPDLEISFAASGPSREQARSLLSSTNDTQPCVG